VDYPRVDNSPPAAIVLDRPWLKCGFIVNEYAADGEKIRPQDGRKLGRPGGIQPVDIEQSRVCIPFLADGARHLEENFC